MDLPDKKGIGIIGGAYGMIKEDLQKKEIKQEYRDSTRVCQNRHILFSYQIQFGSLSMQPFPASAILKTPNSSPELSLSVCFPYKFGQGVA